MSRIIIKIGTSTLIDENGVLDLAYLEDFVRQVHEVIALGNNVAIVSSGAIGTSLGHLKFDKKPSDLPTLQACASIGQLILSKEYGEAFAKYEQKVAQILITRTDTMIDGSKKNLRNTIEKLFEIGAIPLINENDTVAVDEIRFGDNDRLAALVAVNIEADLLILLSDIEGLYTTDPRVDAQAHLISDVNSLTDEVYEAAGGAGSIVGSGGMISKLEAAKELMGANIPMIICEGHKENIVIDAVSGKSVGTKFDGRA